MYYVLAFIAFVLLCAWALVESMETSDEEIFFALKKFHFDKKWDWFLFEWKTSISPFALRVGIFVAVYVPYWFLVREGMSSHFFLTGLISFAYFFVTVWAIVNIFRGCRRYLRWMETPGKELER
jgi:hypothetical protein